MFKKILLIITASIVLLILTMVVIDYYRVKNSKLPWFTLEGPLIKDGGSRFYYGIGYKVLKCRTLSGDNSIKFGSYSMEYSCNNLSIDIDLENITSMTVTKIEKCDNKAKLYYEGDDQDIYVYCLSNITISDGESNVELSNYLKDNFDKLDGLISKFAKEPKGSYDDGGTKLYYGEMFNVLKCHTIGDNNDIYIGNKNMGYNTNFCE